MQEIQGTQSSDLKRRYVYGARTIMYLDMEMDEKNLWIMIEVNYVEKGL